MKWRTRPLGTAPPNYGDVVSLVDELPSLEAGLRSLADDERASEMANYMNDRFSFLGVSTPHRRAAVKEHVDTRVTPEHDDLVKTVEILFAMNEREFHYVGVDLLRRWQRVLTSADIEWLGRLATTHSWWDSVDALATHPIGHVVLADRSLSEVIDRWAASTDLWLNRTAILHQLLYKDATDVEQLFRYCDLHAASTEFYHRKAIGWALRQYARTDPDAVRGYVETRRDVLSGLSIREALKHL